MSGQFTTYHITDPASVLAFGEWLTSMSQAEQAVAIAVKERQNRIALASVDDAWVIDPKHDGGMSLSVLHLHLIERDHLSLITRDGVLDIPSLVKVLTKSTATTREMAFRRLAGAVTGDLTAAAYVVNQTATPAKKFRLIEHDAYETALLEPQWRQSARSDTVNGNFYENVGVPLTKLTAEASIFVGKKAQPEWWASFPDLWLRVFAYLTGDPTLNWAFMEGRDPIEAMAKLFKVTPATAEALLTWQACGADMTCLARHFPERLNDLPDDMREMTQAFERHMPSVVHAVKQIQNVYWQERNCKTIYGRRLKPGNPEPEAVFFRVFGSVEDILAVAAVTLWNNRASDDVRIHYVAGGPTSPVIRIGGSLPKEGAGAWIQQAQLLSTLGDPLKGIELSPTIVQP